VKIDAEASSEMKQIPHAPQRISQIPQGIYFVENKKHCSRSAFCFLGLHHENANR